MVAAVVTAASVEGRGSLRKNSRGLARGVNDVVALLFGDPSRLPDDEAEPNRVMSDSLQRGCKLIPADIYCVVQRQLRR